MKFRLGQFALALMALTGAWATYTAVLGVGLPVLVGLLLITATLAGALRGENAYFGRPMIAFSLYVVLIAMSGFWSISGSFWWTWGHTQQWLTYLLAFFGVVNFLRDERAIRWFALASAVGAMITFVLLSPYEFEAGNFSSRYAVPGHNANFTAYVLAGIIFVLVLTLRHIPNRRSTRLLLMLGIGAGCIGLALTGTRGAQASVLLSTIVIYWSGLFNRTMARIATSVVLLIGVAFSLGLLTPFLVWIDSFSERSTGDLSGRLIIWVNALEYIYDRPVLGIGPGSFVEFGSLGVGVHNVFLLVLLDTGIVGLTVLAWFFFEVWRAVSMLGRDGQKIFLAFVVYWLPIAFSGHWETAPYSWAVVGFVICLARVRERTRSSLPIAQPAMVARAHPPPPLGRPALP